jgi:hypothetical protein
MPNLTQIPEYVSAQITPTPSLESTGPQITSIPATHLLPNNLSENPTLQNTTIPSITQQASIPPSLVDQPPMVPASTAPISEETNSNDNDDIGGGGGDDSGDNGNGGGDDSGDNGNGGGDDSGDNGNGGGDDSGDNGNGGGSSAVASSGGAFASAG